MSKGASQAVKSATNVIPLRQARSQQSQGAALPAKKTAPAQPLPKRPAKSTKPGATSDSKAGGVKRAIRDSAEKTAQSALPAQQRDEAVAVTPQPQPLPPSEARSYGVFPADSRLQDPASDFKKAFGLLGSTGKRGDHLSVELPRGGRSGSGKEKEAARYRINMAFNASHLAALQIGRDELVQTVLERSSRPLVNEPRIAVTYAGFGKGANARLVFTLLEPAQQAQPEAEASFMSWLSMGRVNCYSRKTSMVELMRDLQEWSKGVRCRIRLSRELALLYGQLDKKEALKKALLQMAPELVGSLPAAHLDGLVTPGLEASFITKLDNGMKISVSLKRQTPEDLKLYLQLEQIFD